MSSRKPARDRRTTPPRSCNYTKAFLKDWERLSRAGHFDMHRIKEVMLLIIADAAPLGAEWRDHPLKGEWQDHRECHVGGDFLLIYRLSGDSVIFVRTGTHSDLFGS